MKKTSLLSLALGLFLVLSFAPSAFAAAVNFSADATAAFTAGNCTVMSGATATTFVLNGNTLTVTQVAGEVLTLECPTTFTVLSDIGSAECLSTTYRLRAANGPTTIFTASAGTFTGCGSSNSNQRSTPVVTSSPAPSSSPAPAATSPNTVSKPAVLEVKKDGEFKPALNANPESVTPVLENFSLRTQEVAQVIESLSTWGGDQLGSLVRNLMKLQNTERKEVSQDYKEKVKEVKESDLPPAEKKKALAEAKKEYQETLKDLQADYKSVQKEVKEQIKEEKKTLTTEYKEYLKQVKANKELKGKERSNLLKEAKKIYAEGLKTLQGR